jgi:hypothetical protein
LKDAPLVTGVIAVATAEQMAVSETLGPRVALARDLGIELEHVIVNRTFPSRFSAADAVALASAPDDRPDARRVGSTHEPDHSGRS